MVNRTDKDREKKERERFQNVTSKRHSPPTERRDRCQEGASKTDTPTDVRPDRFQHVYEKVLTQVTATQISVRDEL